MTNRRTLLLAALLTCGAGVPACVTAPRIDERGPLASARRLLDLEFGARRARERREHQAAIPAAITDELTRAPRLADLPAATGGELRRATGIAPRAFAVGAAELRRRPRNLELLLPEQRDLAQALADDLDHGVWLFGPSQRPLNEIDDRRHRTDPDDDRAERSLLERLLRRLDL